MNDDTLKQFIDSIEKYNDKLEILIDELKLK